MALVSGASADAVLVSPYVPAYPIAPTAKTPTAHARILMMVFLPLAVSGVVAC
jgi:hypothetical protein